MHNFWNPWHGCIKKSEGCENCYMYFLDRQRNKLGTDIYRVKSNFDYPLHRDKSGNFKIKSGEILYVCMTSDFFLKEADEWRNEAWDIMEQRPDVIFILITKRPERILDSMPNKLNLDHIWLNVTCENQKRADERIPILINLPLKHKGIMIAPFIGEISLERYLRRNSFNNVWCGGENYNGSRPLYYDWVKKLSDECKKFDTNFNFFETGNTFIHNNQEIKLSSRKEQAKYAYLLNLNYQSSKALNFNISSKQETQQLNLFKPEKEISFFKEHCQYCTIRTLCNGCSKCNKCGYY